MSKRTTLFLTLCLSFTNLPESYSAEAINQQTKGDQSPAVFVSPGGTSSINYKFGPEIEQITSSINNGFSKCFESAIAFQSEKVDELNKKLAVLLVQNESVPEEDAKKWATDIIKNAPDLRKEIDNNNAFVKKYNEELSKDIMGKVYITFTYLFETIDNRLLALKELNPSATFSKSDKFIIFSDESGSIKGYTARSFVLVKGNRIDINLVPGRINKGLIQTCPSLHFIESAGQNWIQSFQINPHYGGLTITTNRGVELKKERIVESIKYQATGEEVLTTQFKQDFERAFSEFIKLAFAR